MSQNEQLLPCPFCGGRADIKVGGHTKYVMCLKCEVMGPNLSDDNELIAAWNTRPAQQAAPEGEVITKLDYFAARAPAEPQAWFQPKLATLRPLDAWQGEDGTFFRTRRAAEEACGDCFSNSSKEQQANWDKEYDKQLLNQWPYAWARAVLKQENGNV